MPYQTVILNAAQRSEVSGGKEQKAIRAARRRVWSDETESHSYSGMKDLLVMNVEPKSTALHAN